MIGWLWTITGICLGNTLWLSGMIILGVAIWAYRVKPESIQKMVGMMSMMTGGQPKGVALKMKGLIEPVDRRKEFANRMLIASLAILIVGCSFVSRCA